MAEGKLVIGTKRYSSWSMRGWLPVRLAGLDVMEQVLPLSGGYTPEVRAASPSGRVPYLEHGDVRVWDSLAIAEYCAEQAPGLWPADPVARAHARAISAEMHSGFQAVRSALPMNLGRNAQPLASGITAEMEAEIARIDTIWSDTRSCFGAGGIYLFGAEFGIADAMFAPIVARFLGYGVTVSPASQHYMSAVRAHPLVALWYDQAAEEPAAWLLDRFESIA